MTDGGQIESQQIRKHARLESWKEIAAYLEREVRTVQRWEKTLNLPVRRIQLKKRGSVYALRDELDRWREQRDQTMTKAVVQFEAGGEDPRVTPRWLLVIAIVRPE